MNTFSPKIDPLTRGKLSTIRLVAEKRGYSYIGHDVLGNKRRQQDLKEFLRLIDKMPADVYDHNVARRRFVTYAHFYKSADDMDSLLYFTEPEYDFDIGARLFCYQLTKAFNPENDEPRKFAPVPDNAIEHTFLHQLIEAGFHAVPLPPAYRKLPIEVEVQFIRSEPRRNMVAMGTPPTTHQDNDWAFCVFLLEWENVEGAENAFVDRAQTNKSLSDVPDAAILDQVRLIHPLEGYCVEDTKIAHYVGPVRLKRGAEYGRRTIVILSYKPLVPIRPEDVKKTTRMLRERPELLAEMAAVPDTIEVGVLSENEQARRNTFTLKPPSQKMILLRHGFYEDILAESLE
jgi:hypothetical protein